MIWIFQGRAFTQGMHVPERVTRSCCTYGPTDRLVRALPFELIGSERTGVPSLLGFNNLLPTNRCLGARYVQHSEFYQRQEDARLA